MVAGPSDALLFVCGEVAFSHIAPGMLCMQPLSWVSPHSKQNRDLSPTKSPVITPMQDGVGRGICIYFILFIWLPYCESNDGY